jgi:hypothetical protein
MLHITATFTSALVFIGIVSSTRQVPLFSWDTVPVFNHLANSSGPFDDETVRFLAKFPIVTIEKTQGALISQCCAEDKIIAAAKQIKAVNSSTYTVFYLNSVIDWPEYRLHQVFMEHPDWWLRNASGQPVHVAPPGDKTVMEVFDFSQEVVRQLWMNVCFNAGKSGVIDGFFADRAGEDNFAHNTLTPEKEAAYSKGHLQVLQDLQTAIADNILIANNAVLNGVFGTMLESFAANEESIQSLMEAVDKGRLVEVHAGYHQDGTDNFCKDVNNSLAAFLIGAGPYSYYGCSRGWGFSDHQPSDWLVWHPQYDKPLGEPLGEAVKNGSVYIRHFAKGTTVRFDTSDNRGTIDWGS